MINTTWTDESVCVCFSGMMGSILQSGLTGKCHTPTHTVHLCIYLIECIQMGRLHITRHLYRVSRDRCGSTNAQRKGSFWIMSCAFIIPALLGTVALQSSVTFTPIKHLALIKMNMSSLLQRKRRKCLRWIGIYFSFMFLHIVPRDITASAGCESSQSAALELVSPVTPAQSFRLSSYLRAQGREDKRTRGQAVWSARRPPGGLAVRCVPGKQRPGLPADNRG